MDSWLGRLKLLVWKNWKLERSSPKSVVEIVLPLFFALLTALSLRRGINSEYTPVTNFSRFEVSGSWRDFERRIEWNDMWWGDSENTSMLSNGFRPRILYYAPQTDVTSRIAESIVGRFLSPQLGNMSIFGFETEAALVANLTDALEYDTLNIYYGGIIFDDKFAAGSPGQKIQYKLRLPANNGWLTGQMYPNTVEIGPREKHDPTGGQPGYWYRGFLTLQRSADAAITEYLFPDEQANFSVNLQAFPYPEYLDNSLMRTVLNANLPSVFLYGFMMTVVLLATTAAEEKELKLKEYMRVMGLSNSVHFLSHFLVKYVKLLAVGAILTVIFYSKFGPVAVFSNVHPLIFLIFLLLHIAAILLFALMCSAPFYKATAGASAASMGFIMPSLICQLVVGNIEKVPVSLQIPLSLITPFTATFTLRLFIDHEATATTLDFSNIAEPRTSDDVSMLTMLMIYVFDIILYAALTGYMDTLRPGETGVKPPPWFPFMPSYWFPKSSQVEASGDFERVCSAAQSRDSIEAEPPNTKPSISIRKLTKEFRNGAETFKAVNELSVRMFPSQVFALLGHNGAGKSTTMAMLTGLLSPSSGSAVINDFDIRDGLGKIRKNIGLCPQHNILFKELTVDFHLQFFVKLKGCEFDSAEADRLLEALSLSDKRTTKAGKLSGGMQRKLSLAIALIGGSEIVMLDEPTSGMDPGARHDTWKLLQAEKAKRTMLLSTHYMEEADLLGDRIGILAHGELQCCGSGIFLKHLYGAGYHVTVVFETGSGSAQSVQVDGLLEFIQKHVSGAQLEHSGGQEATYLLPANARSLFSSLFADLETEQTNLGVSSFGVSVTTMEEVFLKVGELADEKKLENAKLDAAKAADGAFENPVFVDDGGEKVADFSKTDLTSTQRLTGVSLYMQQYKALLLKRVKCAVRSPSSLFEQIFSPLMVLFIQLISMQTLPSNSQSAEVEGPLTLSMAPFKDTVVSIMNSSTNPAYRKVIDSYFLNFDNSKFAVISPGKMESDLLSIYAKHSTDFVDKHFIAGVGHGFSGDPDSTIVAYFNSQPFHTPAITLNLIDNAILGSLSSASERKYYLETVNHPLPPTASSRVQGMNIYATIKAVMIALMLQISLTMAATYGAVFTINERLLKSKHVQIDAMVTLSNGALCTRMTPHTCVLGQFLSGANPVAFWHAALTWDGGQYAVVCCADLVLLAVFGISYFSQGSAILLTAALVAAFGFALLPLVYAASMFFKKDSTALSTILLSGIFLGAVPLMASIVMRAVKGDVADWIDAILLPIDPWYCLASAISSFYFNQQLHDQCSSLLSFCNSPLLDNSAVGVCCETPAPFTTTPWQLERPGIGRHLILLLIQGIAFFIILFCIESGMLRSAMYKFGSKSLQTASENVDESKMDDDVLAERALVSKLSEGEAEVLAQDLTKRYGSLRAVNKLSFAVRPQECFGLLGVNGAGKTSTFEMITGEIMITGGEAILNGTNIGDVGYCPQVDALLPKLTTRETIALYARIKGVPEAELDSIVTNTLRAVGIEKFSKTLAEKLSGGNKRRLCLAVAMVGAPKLLLLDEPTTGVDPKARRSVWDVLLRARQHGTAIVLTSHSMEECEALCTRLGIMVAGQFRCMGPPQHLKSKYGLGYGLQVKLLHLGAVDNAIARIGQTFPGSKLKEQHHTLLIYELASAADTRWSTLFSTLESMVDELDILDYSLSQPTLEQVFLEFSRQAVSTE